MSYENISSDINVLLLQTESEQETTKDDQMETDSQDEEGVKQSSPQKARYTLLLTKEIFFADFIADVGSYSKLKIVFFSPMHKFFFQI